MKRLDDGRLRDIEDVFGMVVHHPQEVRISSSAIGFLESRRSAVGRTLSTRYLWWIAFLLCWLLFGRVLPIWSMVNDGFDGVFSTKGIEVGVPLTIPQAHRLLDGEKLLADDGTVWIDPATRNLHELRVEPDGTYVLDGLRWSAAAHDALCPEGGRTALVLVRPVGPVTYKTVIDAIDDLIDGNESSNCWVSGWLVTAPHTTPPTRGEEERR